MAAEHRDQVRLAAYLNALEEDLNWATTRPAPPLAIDLHIGLPGNVDLLEHRDLDNYLYPVAHRLGADAIVAAFARKDHCYVSTICAGTAAPGRLEGGDWSHATVRTDVSASTSSWKQLVFDQVAAQAGRTDKVDLTSPLEMHIRFTVSPNRNWIKLWKPAIDSLGPVLGMPHPSHPFAPADGRIAALGLHRCLDPSLGNGVVLDVWWRRRPLCKIVNEHGDGIGGAVEFDDAVVEALRICSTGDAPGGMVSVVDFEGGPHIYSVRATADGGTVVHAD